MLFLSWQTYFCRDKTFDAANICHNRHHFVVTKVLLWQAYFCCDKHVFDMTKHVFCCDKTMLVTKLLLWQTHVCCDKYLWQMCDKYATNICCNKSFVAMSSSCMQLWVTVLYTVFWISTGVVTALLLRGWCCQVKLLPSRHKLCVHHTTMSATVAIYLKLHA